MSHNDIIVYEQRIYTNITNYEFFIRNIPARRRQAIGFVVRIPYEYTIPF